MDGNGLFHYRGESLPFLIELLSLIIPPVIDTKL